MIWRVSKSNKQSCVSYGSDKFITRRFVSFGADRKFLPKATTLLNVNGDTFTVDLTVCSRKFDLV